jgi:dipeptidase
MCDTFIAAASATKHHQTLFAKNSDRPPNEAQHLLSVPAMKYEAGEYVACTYIRIPQIKETLAILLSKPFWMWGAEMGVNEAGVAIGNEAVFSKIPANKEPALLGMDLLRLALERATTSKEAVDIIAALLEKYGQGGNCAHKGELYYHNSFLIADPQQAWVLETIDRDWAAHQVDELYSISNVLTLQSKWDIASPGIESYAAKAQSGVDLSRDYSDFLYTTFSNARARCELTSTTLKGHLGAIEIDTMAGILRNKGDHPDPSASLSRSNVCMHAGFGPVKISQTTASMIAVLDNNYPLVFATGTSAPCTGIFKPVWIDTPLPEMGPAPNDFNDRETLFWAHEHLHRAVLRNYDKRINTYATKRDQLEKEFISGAVERSKAPFEERSAYSALCFKRAADAEREWLIQVSAIPEKPSFMQLLQNTAWNRFNKDAQLE